MADIDTSAAAIAAMLDGVTDGPWTDRPSEIADEDDYSVDRQEDGHDGLCYSAVGVKGGQTVAIVVVPMSFGMDAEQAANARFIAAARELVPALSRDLEAMRAERAALQAQVHRALLDRAVNGVWLGSDTERARAALSREGGE